jgi:multidrug efflux pump subunit AcrA (membrane-fusion protein)
MAFSDYKQKVERRYRNLTRRQKLISIVGGIIALALLFVFFSGSEEPTPETVTKPPVVTVGTVASLAGGDAATFVGTVRSVSEAAIQTEAGGRVTTVRVAAGDTVRAGAIIATLENASEQASVLQAQGAYEAALAAARQSSVGVEEARTTKDAVLNNTVVTISSAYSTVAGIVRTDIDPFFANPDSTFPAPRIDAYGQAEQIRTERIAVTNTLRTWQGETAALTPTSNLSEAVSKARNHIDTVIMVTDSLLMALNRDTNTESVLVAERTARIASLTNTKNALLSLKNSLQGSLTNLANAEDAVRRAEIAGSNSGPSASSAQIKQALGSLRSAQAALEKTILRSPITGTVEVLQVKTGDFVSPQTAVARVAGGQGLEISIFVGENDIDTFAVGDTVSINGTATGTVVNIAPAFDATTKKREVKVAATDASLIGGASVSVTLAGTQSTSTRPLTLQVPITAVKFTDTAGEVFVVVDNKLEPRPVTVGPINGTFVTILSGIDQTTEFVLDARGKTAGEVVEVKTK